VPAHLAGLQELAALELDLQPGVVALEPPDPADRLLPERVLRLGLLLGRAAALPAADEVAQLAQFLLVRLLFVARGRTGQVRGHPTQQADRQGQRQQSLHWSLARIRKSGSLDATDRLDEPAGRMVPPRPVGVVYHGLLSGGTCRRA